MTCPHKFEDKLDAVEVGGHCALCSEQQYAVLSEKANNLARLVEQLAYAPVAGYYQQQGNDAPLRLLRLAVEDLDRLIGKGK